MSTKYLVIVESPAKARTISKFLGKDYVIEASIGHIRDLPQGAKEVPEKYRSEPWAYLGVNVDDNFEPVYIIPKDKKKQVDKLKSLLKNAEELYLATDEDREGEAISWHLCQVLKPKVPVRRLVFHEITKKAIHESLRNPREINEFLVRAQESRRILDRLYGYDVSPLLWRKIGPKLSAGRVQSVAVRLIVERERARMSFRAATYWDLQAVFLTKENQSFEASLTAVNGKRIPSSRDFDPSTGQLKNSEDCLQMTEAEIKVLVERLQTSQNGHVANVEDKFFTQKPPAPFTTSTLQQEANRKHGFSARRTMQVAQSLYENGYITYMRTDSTTLSSEAIQAARHSVETRYGKEYLPATARQYQTKVKNAQEAHEAIRPAGTTFHTPEELRLLLTEEEYKLYDMIWKRTIASQMLDAEGRRMTITVNLEDAQFSASGKTITFPGYLRAYVESFDEMEDSEGERVLPPVKMNDALDCTKLEPKVHTTQPPNRYSEASLTRTLEEKGIGRPSTYASIIDTILARNYVFKKGSVLIPTWMAFAVCQLLETHLPNLIDYQFTADMEDELDAVSRGEMDWLEYLRTFYFGDETGKNKNTPALKPLLKNKLDEIDARAISTILIGTPENGEPLYVRVGRYGPYLEQGERRISLPDGIAPDELSVQKGLEMLERAQQGEEPLGFDPKTNKPIFVKVGRFGPYIQCGTSDDAEKPVNVSLLKGMHPEEVDLETALKLLSLPRILGKHPENGEEILASNGRYGPYIKCGDETRSLPEDLTPIDITLDQALDLLSQPKTVRGRTAAAPATKSKEPLRIFDISPVTGNPVTVMSGRFGPYVTDGKTNAALPKTVDPAEVTFEIALELLEVRAAKGPVVRKRITRKKATKKTSTKKVVKKKAPTKKTVKKKSSVKKTTVKKTKTKVESGDAPFTEMDKNS
ncbi:MAG: type I DNA topoisomerase [Planctomycetia bacterium]|nr:type I DNA topoisomerase [Planctomycetia bacterium]